LCRAKISPRRKGAIITKTIGVDLPGIDVK
jgi:hypothetical protein